uniref:Uncharacterized protein n=1 Tax=Physcomitrium patens TaxID=3218 RepID=A0A2K1K057_PHYPA|nr:hypothetical protein PHYPA_014278 [Physcomitrium patens]
MAMERNSRKSDQDRATGNSCAKPRRLSRNAWLPRARVQYGSQSQREAM